MVTVSSSYRNPRLTPYGWGGSLDVSHTALIRKSRASPSIWTPVFPQPTALNVHITAAAAPTHLCILQIFNHTVFHSQLHTNVIMPRTSQSHFQLAPGPFTKVRLYFNLHFIPSPLSHHCVVARSDDASTFCLWTRFNSGLQKCGLNSK